MQTGQPVAYYSKKLNSAQMNYATIDKELLCVIATLREFRSMLLGAELHLQRQLRWISYVDEYGPELHYIEGPRNVIADTFSRLSRNDESSPLVGKKAANVISNYESDNDKESFYSLIIDGKEILDCLLSLPCISSNKNQIRTDDKQKILVTVYKAPPDHCHKKRCRDTDINQHCHHRNHCLHNDISNQCYLK